MQYSKTIFLWKWNLNYKCLNQPLTSISLPPSISTVWVYLGKFIMSFPPSSFTAIWRKAKGIFNLHNRNSWFILNNVCHHRFHLSFLPTICSELISKRAILSFFMHLHSFPLDVSRHLTSTRLNSTRKQWTFQNHPQWHSGYP